MSWQAVAKKDYRDGIRSPYFWGVTAFVVLVIGFFLFRVVQLLTNFQESQNVEVELTTTVFVQALQPGFRVLVPVLGLVIAFASVAGERDSGSLKLLLSLPNTREDVLAGKLLGRSAVVATPLLVAFVVGAIIFPFSEYTLVPTVYAAFAAFTLLLALVFVAVGLGVSAAVSTSRRAAVGAFGIYAYLIFFWQRLARNVPSLLADVTDITRGTKLQLEVFLQLLNPMSAYKTLVLSFSLTPDTRSPMDARSRLITRGSGGSTSDIAGQIGQTANARQYLLKQVFVDSVPWYFTDWMVLAYVALWIVVPLAVGYVLFRGTDL